MSFDFNASQIRTTQIIASGSKTTTPAIMIYGSGSATSYTGAYTADVLSKVGTDTFLFVSGTIGKRGVSGAKALTLFGGDIITSGSVTALLGLSGSLTRLSDGKSYLVAGSNVTITSASNGQVTISSTGGGTPSDNSNFWFDFPNAGVGKIYTTGSVAIGLVGSSDTKGNDVFFFTSGTIGGRGVTGTSVFGGDLVTSGTLYSLSGISGSLTRLTDGTSYLREGSNITIASSSNGAITISSTGGAGSSLFTDPAAGKINTTGSLALAGNLGSSYITSNVGSDVFFFASGSIAGRGVSGTSVFGGDLVTSGSLYALNGNATVSATAGSSTITLTSAGGSTTFTETNSGNLEIRNTALAGQFVASVKTSGGVTSNFLDVRPNGSSTGSVISIFPSSIYTGAANPFNSSDTTFFVAGKNGAKGGNTRGTAVFGGDTVISGSAYLGTSNTDNLVVNGRLASDIIPDGNRTRNLGSDTARFANVYTGDLHLRNERGDYTLIEEEDCLTIRFNKTGKRYKFVLERAPEYDE